MRSASPCDPPRVLALDQSLTGTGFAYRATTTGEIMIGRITPGKRTGVARLHYIVDKVEEIIRYARPELMVLEGYAYSGGNSGGRGGVSGRVFELGELGGVLKLIAFRYAVKTATIGSGSMKKVVTGKGRVSAEEKKADKNAEKIAVSRGVTDLTGYVVEQFDEADSVGLLITAEAMYFNYGPDEALKRVRTATVGEVTIGGCPKAAKKLYE